MTGREDNLRLRSLLLSLCKVLISPVHLSLSSNTSKATMGTHKRSNAKKATNPAAKKRKLSTKVKIADPIPRPKRPCRRPGFAKAWEEWEDNIVLGFHREGTTYAQISQQLSHRTLGACIKRQGDLKARRQKARRQSKDAPVLRVPKMPDLVKDWEDWEDQVLLAKRAAGWTWKNISRLLHRSLLAVKTRARRDELSMKLRLTPRPAKQSSDPESGGRSDPWNQEEDQVLRSLRESGKSFPEIARKIPNRSRYACEHRFEVIRQDTRKRRPYWEEWEERLLVSGYFNRQTWEEISRTITGRTKSACTARWWKYFRSTDLDDPWTAEDLALLQDLRSQGSSWRDISKAIPGHSTNACKTHWYKETEGIQGTLLEYGRGATCVPWSTQEVETLVSLYNTIGPRYQEICKHLPGRTAFACQSCLLKCTKEDGVGGPPSEFWKDFFASKLHADTSTCLEANSLDDGEAGGVDSISKKAITDESGSENVPMPRLRRNQQRGVDARKRKLLDIPMI